MVLKVHLTVPGLEASHTLHYVLSRLSYPTLCNPMDCSLPGSPVHGILLSMGFSRQEYWNGLSCPSPGIFLTQGSNLYLLCPLHWQVGSLTLVTH